MRSTKVVSVVLGASLLTIGAMTSGGVGAAEESGNVGINVVLGTAVTDGVLADLGRFGQVLDVLPEIKGVTLRSKASELAAIQALPYVAAAGLDRECELAGAGGLPVPDLSGGANNWCLDAIDVTDFGAGRTVAYDGAGVYVAVLDTGLQHNWRAYFPEERIAAGLARCFGGGGGDPANITSQPEKWGHDTDGHGTNVTSSILGFAYSGPDGALPAYFNGVAPRATVIPVKLQSAVNNHSGHWESQIAHAIVYVTRLKVDGALGGAPLVINLSNGLHRPLVLERAAIGYAIDNGVVVVAAAGNEADAGMRYPAAYPEVISVAATGWIGGFAADDPTTYRWMLRDVPENDATQHFIAPFSSRALAGQDLDVAGPGAAAPVAWTLGGQPDYTFALGTSHACPHVAGVAALMLQKNPGLTQSQVESILESTAMPLAPGSAVVRWPAVGPGNFPTWSDHGNVSIVDLPTSWGANATGTGLVQADAALAATPLP